MVIITHTYTHTRTHTHTHTHTQTRIYLSDVLKVPQQGGMMTGVSVTAI